MLKDIDNRVFHSVDNKAVADSFAFECQINGCLGTDGEIVLPTCGRLAVIDHKFPCPDTEEESLFVSDNDSAMLSPVEGLQA